MFAAIANAYGDDIARRAEAKAKLEEARAEREQRLLDALFDKGDPDDDSEFTPAF